MSLLKKLFGGSRIQHREAATEHNGFSITPTPIPEGGEYRVCAEITKSIEGKLESHRLVRADLCSSKDEAVRLSIAKAQQMIDFEGDRIFKIGGGW